MGWFRKLSNLASPRKAEFIKRLMARRQATNTDPFFSNIAVKGSDAYALRTIGLESLEFAVCPEATIVNVLEQYRKPHVFNFYRDTLAQARTEEERQKCHMNVCGHIEYLLTGIPDAATRLPQGLNLTSFIRYKIHIEHPNDPYIADSINDELISYAIEESAYVFR